jgi:hypothetical protein
VRLPIFATALLWASLASAQQAPPAEPQSTPKFVEPQQLTSFETAKQQATAGKWSEAQATLRPLHDALPDDVDLTRFTAECAIDAGDRAYALSLLEPIIADKPGSWQELLLATRSYAEMHNDAARDKSFAALIELFNSHRHPKLNAIQIFLVERVPLPNGHMDLYMSLVPWSRYSIYEMARVFNASGQQLQRITLESNDMEQASFAKEHPDLAAKGARFFSLDGYTEQTQPDGRQTQTHYTYGFFNGSPGYGHPRSHGCGRYREDWPNEQDGRNPDVRKVNAMERLSTS